VFGKVDTFWTYQRPLGDGEHVAAAGDHRKEVELDDC
jgi:hypothetical protein